MNIETMQLIRDVSISIGSGIISGLIVSQMYRIVDYRINKKNEILREIYDLYLSLKTIRYNIMTHNSENNNNQQLRDLLEIECNKYYPMLGDDMLNSHKETVQKAIRAVEEIKNNIEEDREINIYVMKSHIYQLMIELLKVRQTLFK